MDFLPQVVWWLGMSMGCAALGALARRLAEVYADLLADGAVADAHTLYRAAWHVRRCTGSVTMDGPGALLGAGVGAWCFPGPAGGALAAACLLLYLLAWIDARSGLLPDALTLPLLSLGLVLGPLLWQEAVLAALLAWGLAAGGARLYRWRRGHEGFGGGDVKLLAALAAWLGAEPLCWVLLAACLAGLVWAMVTQRSWRPGGAYPFGPFLVLAALPALMAWPAVQS